MEVVSTPTLTWQKITSHPHQQQSLQHHDDDHQVEQDHGGVHRDGCKTAARWNRPGHTGDCDDGDDGEDDDDGDDGDILKLSHGCTYMTEVLSMTTMMVVLMMVAMVIFSNCH